MNLIATQQVALDNALVAPEKRLKIKKCNARIVFSKPQREELVQMGTNSSGSGDGVGSQPKVPDEQQDKTTGTNEGTGTKPGVPDVPKDHSESENESWGNSKDDDNNDDNNDDVSNDDDDDDDVDSDAGDDNEASDSKKTDSDEDENPNLNQNEDEEEEYEEEYVRTPDIYGFTDDDEEYEELYKDVNVITHTHPLVTISVTIISKTSTAAAPTIPLIIPSITPLPQQSTPTPTPAPTNETTTTLIPALLDFSSLFGFNQRVSILERDLSQLKQVDYSAQLLETIKSQIPAMVDAQLSTRREDSIQKAFRAYTAEFEKKAQGEKKRYIDLVEKSVKDINKDEVKR
ncbi:hypothetical protein Tco_1321641 [Tanacetum coccineum]